MPERSAAEAVACKPGLARDRKAHINTAELEFKRFLWQEVNQTEQAIPSYYGLRVALRAPSTMNLTLSTSPINMTWTLPCNCKLDHGFMKSKAGNAANTNNITNAMKITKNTHSSSCDFYHTKDNRSTMSIMSTICCDCF